MPAQAWEIGSNLILTFKAGEFVNTGHCTPEMHSLLWVHYVFYNSSELFAMIAR